MSLSIHLNYHIYVIYIAKNCSLFVDYLFDDVDDNEPVLLQQIRNASDIKLQHWLENTSLQDMDVFEIELASSYTVAQEAVEFWNAYFRSIGISVIEIDHICDWLMVNKV
ncbi:Uncharacterised protein [Yersinia pseudotuberculosis]|uniref:hypothetical protein n=1 Tax=Yersinia pseudotuberculosis TaxID=633 RepID=UPI0005E76135|nr:hypothetical protein [Yersinia pseudotuberculosis]BET64083.1 hypothetical protein YPSE1_35420 [Yersinia pseudotuberculosis]CFV30006.1 Uncharacterised protein [Yersinia pseudotuberculosis]CNL38095.1 Uncharacterised protein [Yersinia pseudotuberculosis]